jgi:fatty acid desaturase
MSSTIELRDLLTKDEIDRLSAPSDLAGARAVIATWAVIGFTFAGLAWLPHPITFVLAIVVLGGRQLALAVLMHEAAHRSLFRSRVLNDTVTDWLCARPVWGHVSRYRKHHIGHHAHVGTERDPDRSLVAPFPISRASLARKLARDLLGISGVKRAIGLVMMDAEIIRYDVSGDLHRLEPAPLATRLRALAANAGGMALGNLALLAILSLAGHAWLYLAWAVAWLTTYGLFVRLRSLAEHACTETTRDPMRNTRTTDASWLARATVAPLHVSYHLEHHLLAATPYDRLPELRRLLRERGALAGSKHASSYLEVLRTVSRPAG